MKEKYLVISAQNIGGVAIQKEPRAVLVEIELAQSSAHVVYSPGFLLQLSPTEARHIAQMLVRKADEAEEGLPRA